MRLLLAVVLALAAAPAAGASSYSVPTRLPSDPAGFLSSSFALTGEGVAYFERRGTGAIVVSARADGRARVLATLPAAPGWQRAHDVVASGGTVFAERLVCPRVGCGRNRASVYELLRIDLATDTATPFDGCAVGGGCQICSVPVFKLGLQGSVLTVRGSCARGGVTDLADGTTRQPQYDLLAAAGTFAAVQHQGVSTSSLSVINWRTGERVVTVRDVYLDSLTGGPSIDADGTLAWVQGEDIKVLDPGATVPRSLPLARGPFITQVVVAGGRLAVRRYNPDNDHTVLQVSALDGSGARRVDAQRGEFGWAFDGTRVAWVAQPCGLRVIQVWDLAGDPPAPASERCLRARIASRTLTLNRAATKLRVKLRCPGWPTRGCAGEFSADLLAGGHAVAETYASDYRLLAGETRTMYLGINPVKRLRRAPSMTARVTLHNANGSRTQQRFRVR